MPKIRVRPHAILDDLSNPNETIITIENGLSKLAPPSEHQNAVLRIWRTRNHHLMVETLECSDGVSFNVPWNHRVPEPVVRAHWVRSDAGIWYVLDNRDASPIMSEYLQPLIADVVTNDFPHARRTLVWDDDVDDEPRWFK